MEKRNRKPRDTSKKRNSILDAAVNTFMKLGYYNSTMDLIAEEAAASKRTLYNHFPSKEVLFDAVISRYLKSQEENSNIIFSPKDSILDQLSQIADSEIFLIKTPKNRGLAKVLTSVFLRDPELAIKSKKKYSQLRVKIYDWFKKAKDNGIVNIIDPILEAETFLSMIQGGITWPALFSNKYDNSEINLKKADLINRYLKGIELKLNFKD